MFKRIVSNLPFSPSLISNLRDYDLKLKKELELRVASLFILLLVLFLQLSITIFKPIDTTVSSPNNLTSFSDGTLNQLFNDCVNNTDQYQNILSFYKFDCSDLYSGKTIDLNLRAMNNSLFSLNRLSYDAKNEVVIVVSDQELYVRQLSLGNQLQASNLRVQKLRSGSNIIYIALNSGDIIATKKFLVNNQSPITCSNQSLSSCFKYSMSVRDVTSGKSDVNNATVSSGDILAYTLLADNMSRNEISDFKLSINFDNALAYSKLKNSYGGAVNNGIVSYFISSIAPNQTQTEEITTIVKSPLPSNSISTSDGNYFNQKMITSFGNTVVVSVPKNFNKFYEININDSLPSSNYLTSLIILVGIILVLIYFVLRTSLIRQEIKIIKHTHSNYTARPKK